MRRRRRAVVALLLAAALVAQAACGGREKSSGGRPAPHFKPGFNLFTPEQDVELGRSSAREIAAEAPLLDDAGAAAYISALGARLAAVAPGHDFPYEFRVVAAREINAFALPGGFVYVNAGAVASARSEGELAGVIAHEISHVALRHGTNQASKAYIAQAGLGVLGALAGDRGEVGEIINAVGGAGANMLFLKFGRTAETEADLEGARIMAAAGYDPRDMARFFETLEEASAGKRPPELLSDHPDPGNRVASINELTPSLRLSPTPVRDTQEFQQVRARLISGGALQRSTGLARTGPRDPNDLPAGTRPPPPSQSLGEYSSPDGSYAFRYPDNWDVLRSEGDEASLIFAPRGAYGEMDGAVYVTHGLFVGVVAPASSDLAEANDAFVREQIRVNPDFRLQRGPQPVTFSGGRGGYATIVTGPSTVTGVVEIDVVYTTATGDGRLFYIITMAPEDEYQRYHPAFEQIIGSLQLGG